MNAVEHTYSLCTCLHPSLADYFTRASPQLQRDSKASRTHILQCRSFVTWRRHKTKKKQRRHRPRCHASFLRKTTTRTLFTFHIYGRKGRARPKSSRCPLTYFFPHALRLASSQKAPIRLCNTRALIRRPVSLSR